MEELDLSHEAYLVYVMGYQGNGVYHTMPNAVKNLVPADKPLSYEEWCTKQRRFSNLTNLVLKVQRAL